MATLNLSCIYFFFFQAEDGIRDYKVTGVQTCALPISDRAARGAAGREQRDGGERRESPMHRGATVARTIQGCQKSRVRFENSQRDQVLTSLRTITSTSPPVATLVSPCKTASPSASTIDRRIPDPWSPVSRALHRPFRASRTTRR